MTDFTEVQIAEMVALLDGFPAQAGAAEGVTVPIPPQSKRPWAIQLLKRGARVHQDLADEFPVPGDQPGMGMFNPVKWVPRDEYLAGETAAPADVGEDSQMAAVRALLEVVNPAMLEQIDSLPADQRPDMLKTLEQQVPGAIAKVRLANEQMTTPAKSPRRKPAKKAAARKRAPAKKATPRKRAATPQEEPQ